MSVFTPLKGSAHIKAYVRDQEYKAQYKQYREDNYTKWMNDLSNLQTCVISNDTAMFYIISPSLYKDGAIQLTTFIRNLPHCHNTYNNIEELVKENHFHFSHNQYKITENI